MQRSRFIAMSAGLVGATMSFALAGSADEAIVREIIAALNGKDDALLTRVVAARFADNVPPARRIQNIKRLRDHAPFTFLRMGASGPSEITAFIRDGGGEQTTWTLALDAARRVLSVRVEAGDAAPPPPPDIDQWTDVHALVTRLRVANGAPAMGLAMLYNGALTVAADGTRTAGGAAVGESEPWKIGSIGKPLCTSVIARLIERDVLDWSTTLGSALKIPGMNPAYAGVTLEELMHHRGGIVPDENFSAPMVDRIAAGSADPRVIRSHYAADILSRAPFGPRGEYRYSNAGFALLGHVAETATGKPYETLLHDEVFTPLQMTSSYAHGDALPAARPTGHTRGPGGPRPVEGFAGPLEIMVAPAGGGIWMTMQDLTRFGAAHMAGLQGTDGFLRAATVARLHTGQKEPDGPLVYACGWGITQEPGIGEMHGHNGGDGTFFADFGVFPKLNLVVASAMNYGGPEGAPAQAVRAIGRRYAKSG